jgi:hypothetical protein
MGLRREPHLVATGDDLEGAQVAAAERPDAFLDAGALVTSP